MQNVGFCFASQELKLFINMKWKLLKIRKNARKFMKIDEN